MTRFLLAAACGAAFVLPGLSAAEAQSYGAQSRYGNTAMSYEQCVAQQRNRQVTGAVIGGLLGAVLGAELHDDHQDRAREDRRYRGHRDYRGRDRHYRDNRYRGNRGHRGRQSEQGQGGAVVAGAGVGALAGAALGGASGDCNRYARASTGYGYGGAPGHYGSDAGYRGDPRYDQGGYNDPRYNTGYDNRGYDNRGYDDRGYNDPRYASGGYDDRRADDGYGYDDGYGRSSGELLGGPDYGGSGAYSSGRAEVYTAGSAQGSASAQATGACRDMQSSGAMVYMCQGSDGIWRPAQTYR